MNDRMDKQLFRCKCACIYSCTPSSRMVLQQSEVQTLVHHYHILSPLPSAIHFFFCDSRNVYCFTADRTSFLEVVSCHHSLPVFFSFQLCQHRHRSSHRSHPLHSHSISHSHSMVNLLFVFCCRFGSHKSEIEGGSVSKKVLFQGFETRGTPLSAARLTLEAMKPQQTSNENILRWYFELVPSVRIRCQLVDLTDKILADEEEKSKVM